MLLGMSTQITVRLPEELVEFVDQEVRENLARSRAQVVSRALDRERRRRAQERDVAILRESGPAPDLDALARWAAAVPLDGLEPS
jgi:Arc/MetJ-type ribon-helix-helix transcriptional regulator